MDIEKIIKKENPSWTDAMVTARRVEAFKKLFPSQINYFNWKHKKNKPSLEALRKLSKELNIDLEKLL